LSTPNLPAQNSDEKYRLHKVFQRWCGLSMIETRNQSDMFSEKGTANALPRPRLPI
jgi:hypothetical protein